MPAYAAIVAATLVNQNYHMSTQQTIATVTFTLTGHDPYSPHMISFRPTTVRNKIMDSNSDTCKVGWLYSGITTYNRHSTTRIGPTTPPDITSDSLSLQT